MSHPPAEGRPRERCDPAGCEFPVDITLRWLVVGDGRLEVDVKVRATPSHWPDTAPVRARAQEPASTASPKPPTDSDPPPAGA